MTDERRQDVLIGALVLSVIAHIILMILIRPQVMTHVTSGVNTSRRAPMVVKDAPETTKPIEMMEVADVEAVKESPVAEENLIPISSEFDSKDIEVKSEAPTMPSPTMPAPEPKLEVASYLSEKIYVDEGVSSISTPIAADGLSTIAPRYEKAAPDSKVTDIEALPMFTAPTYQAKAIESSIAEEKPGVIAKDEEKKTEFIPKDEILSTVDEKVVEQEKAAVRELLNVSTASDLSKVVAIEANSATQGDWTYYRVKVSPLSTINVVPKDVVVLLDASGSIGKDRLKSCKEASRKLLRSATNTGDRFNLVAFRDKFSYAFNTWQICDEKSFDKADSWLSSLAAHGRTDVFAVIKSVLTLPRDPKRPLIALVVTDGDANAGVHETSKILSKFTALNDGLISIYMYGVKGTANRELIDVLTHGNRGESYVFDGFRWSAGSYIEGLSNQFRDPVISDMRVMFAAGTETEYYPRCLRNLYRGNTVEFVGRVPKGKSNIAFSLQGLNGSESYEGFFKFDLSKVSFDGKLPAKWNEEYAIDLKLR